MLTNGLHGKPARARYVEAHVDACRHAYTQGELEGRCNTPWVLPQLASDGCVHPSDICRLVTVSVERSLDEDAAGSFSNRGVCLMAEGAVADEDRDRAGQRYARGMYTASGIRLEVGRGRSRKAQHPLQS